jgi:DNA-directed RNA polymerase sigma subunit (sigma70/sigma32)
VILMKIIVAQEDRTLQAQTERAAQTNRIAEAVQRGQLDTLTLWAAVRGYAAKKALRWVAALHHRCGVELDDLMQEAYLAMLRAVRLWRPDGGTGFIGIYELTLRTAFADACGIRTVRSRSDPLQTAVSLDAPVGEDGEEAGTLGSLVPDESAERPFLGIEQQELADAVQESLQSLPENLREAMIDAFWYDKPVDAKLRTTALKALRHPTISRTLRTYI